MALTPKFIYGDTPTTLTFHQPPKLQEKVLVNKTYESQVDDCDPGSDVEHEANYLYQEVWYYIHVQGITIAQLEDFQLWADDVRNGKPFDYYPDSAAGTNYEVRCLSFDFSEPKNGLFDFIIKVRVNA